VENRWRTCIEILDELRKLLLFLVFGDGFWIYFAFFEEPSAELLAFCVEAAKWNGKSFHSF